GVDPNREDVEVNVRRAVFYPERPGNDYITVRGFTMEHAATPWAPPTAEQIGLIGTHWSKGWIIENNVISDSRCVGITLGKDRDTGHNVWSANRDKDGATHYNEVIFRALKAGWSREMIGSHVVRNNTIYNCEQAGIVGSLGGVFSQIYDNHIFDIWTKRAFSGAEIAGIKIHASVDMVIRNNRIHNVGRGIWIDWMAQGTRITRNLLYDNTTDDLFSEVNHGPYVVDNNIFLSDISIRDWSGGGAFVQNLIAGKISTFAELNRFTPYLFPHETMVAGLKNIEGGDNRFYNNIFAGPTHQAADRDFSKEWGNLADGLAVYSDAGLPMFAGGNLYYNGAQPMSQEPGYIVEDHDPLIRIEDDPENAYLYITFHASLMEMDKGWLNSVLFDRTKVSNLPFEDPSGLPIVFDKDFFNQKRSESNPSAGPFEMITEGEMRLKVW
ncbi:MAG: right-handed parallel beta-helix repeat-containing protein, partial [Bacteroidales bacterium]|nr:right-handed parallel beta-helix repeat-containing protein [Bacteroidales bacterium]